MIISVGPDGENNEGVVWLFPVPADPGKIKIDVVKDLPKLNGEEISRKAESNLEGIKMFLQMTQIYTIPYAASTPSSNSGSLDGGVYALGSAGGGKNISDNVIVYEHLDKEGISSEIITAKTANGIYDYLQSKGLKIDAGSIPVLNNYIGKNYSFVVSWISEPGINSLTLSKKFSNILSVLSLENLWGGMLVSGEKRYRKIDKLIQGVYQKYPDFDQDNPAYLESRQGQIVMAEIFKTIETDPALSKELSEMGKIGKNLETNQKGIYVSFPTNDLYFPLVPTSVYGDVIVPASVRIIGHVSPKIFSDIKNYTETAYYVDSEAGIPDDLIEFYSGQNKNLKYTKIEIYSPSKLFTNDLWISKTTPIKTYFPSFVATHPILVFISFLTLSSILASIIAGWICFKELRKKIVKLGLIGLSNCLSLIGLMIATLFVGTKEKNKNTNLPLETLKQKGYFWKRKTAVSLFILALPFLFLDLIILNKISLSDLIDIGEDGLVGLLLLVILVFPPLTILASFLIKSIKAEDKNLFKQLKEANYSSWSFQPKDKMKYLFVPVFSITFLIISWLLVTLTLLVT